MCIINLNVPKYNQLYFSCKRLGLFGPKIWNRQQYRTKSAENLKSLLNNDMEKIALVNFRIRKT